MEQTIITISGRWAGKPYTQHISRRLWWDPDIATQSSELAWKREDALAELNAPLSNDERDVQVKVLPGGRRFARQVIRKYNALGYTPRVVYLAEGKDFKFPLTHPADSAMM